MSRDTGFTVAVVGCGPRGIAVFERLAHHLSTANGDHPRRTVHILLLDATETGRGRVWRSDQPPWLLMNTVIGEPAMFPPGHGPTFAQWLRRHPDPELRALDENDCAPRRTYGGYLAHVCQEVERRLPGHVTVTELRALVTSLRPHQGRHLLEVSAENGTRRLEADAVVLATGHSITPAPPRFTPELRTAARNNPDLLCLGGQPAADLDLDSVPAEAPVGVLGLGLSFYDLLLSFSVGRGGSFHRDGDRLVYLPSGKEPVIHAGSRSGLPITTRGDNQKPAASGSFRPYFFTAAALAGLRKDAADSRGTPALDFAGEVLPLLTAEVDLVHLHAHARLRHGPRAAAALVRDITALGPDARRWREVLHTHALADVAPVDLERLARPFAGRRFTGPADFTSHLHRTLRDDLAQARLGNVRGPLKAALDVIRDARDLLRFTLEHGGLTPSSYRDDFHTRVAPLLSLLSTGPPALRTEQFLALAEAGVVHVVGPDTRFGHDREQRLFTVESPAVPGSRRHVRALIDSRVPAPPLSATDNPLLRQLADEGLAGEFATTADDDTVTTGGLRITAAENRLVDPEGRVHTGLYALGVPTEGARWFTQIGNGRTESRTTFHREADAVAVSIVRRCHSGPPR
ncbi:FAD/NAD(P)-binding protein [Streptomyces sp. NPDC059371]|uniref:FAD/NAD(P)-binding protein n=1 Tax=Streptomyces sp. NPDC059371 TaxID=3346812 RepID=UPI0036D1E292